MSKNIIITIGVPRRRIMAVRGVIYILAAAYRCRLISANLVQSIYKKLCRWIASGAYVK